MSGFLSDVSVSSVNCTAPAGYGRGPTMIGPYSNVNPMSPSGTLAALQVGEDECVLMFVRYSSRSMPPQATPVFIPEPNMQRFVLPPPQEGFGRANDDYPYSQPTIPTAWPQNW